VSSYLELRTLAAEIASQAGRFAAEKRLEGVEAIGTKSSVVDVVTQVDKDAEVLIAEFLRTHRPLDGLLGEEGLSEEGSSGLTWVVDPIDGTVNFLYGIPHYAVSIAAVEGPPEPGQWRVVAGAIYHPGLDELFTASLGGGASLGKTALQVAKPVPLEQTLWLTGFAYSTRHREVQADLVKHILPKVRDIRRMGTASLDLAAIAAGRGNVYFERTLSPWDHAAGELLVTEAGGAVSGVAGRPAGREGLLAGHPEMVEKFLAEIEAFGGDGELYAHP